MRVEIADELEEVLGPWEELFALDDRATPFSSPGWARAWWPHWSDGAKPFVLVVSDGDDPVALAALFADRKGPFRQLRGVGTIVGNYWDVIARPDARVAGTAAIAGALRDAGGRWDAMVLDRLPPASPVQGALADAGLKVRERPPTASPGLELPPSFDDLLAGMSRNRRSKLRKRLRVIDEGPLERRLVTDPAALPAAIERWQTLRTAWWADREKEMLAEHASPRFRAFVLAAVQELVPAGLMEVSEFVRDGEVVGVAVDLVDARAFYYWLDGFDPDIRELGPGAVHITATIRESVEAGRGFYDFMVGQEPYKYEYGAVDRLQPWLVVGNTRAASRAAMTTSALVDRARSRRRGGTAG